MGASLHKEGVMPTRPMRLRHANGVASIAYTKIPVRRGIGQYIKAANLHASLPLEVSLDSGTNYFTIAATDNSLEVNALFHYMFVRSTVDPTAAVITSGSSETYVISDGFTLTVIVDGGVVQTATFNTADFVAIGVATAAEIALVITDDIDGVTAADVAGDVVITTASLGPSPFSTIEVTGGTANAVLNFSTTAVAGTGIAYSILTGEG